MDSSREDEAMRRGMILGQAVVDAGKVMNTYLEVNQPDISEEIRTQVAHILVSMYVGVTLNWSMEQCLRSYCNTMAGIAVRRLSMEGGMDMSEYVLMLTRVGLATGAYTMEHPEWANEARVLLDPFLADFGNPNNN